MLQNVRICFVGDSFVNGTGDETALGWAGRLCAAANACGTEVTYYNLGVRRDTSGDILQRWETECFHRLPKDCDGRIVVSCGVNDTAIEHGNTRVSFEESCRNFREIVRGIRKYKAIAIGPPPVAEDDHNARIKAISEAFAREAEGLQVPYIELFAPLISDGDYKEEVLAYDGAHPRSRGYAKMAGIVSASSYWWF